MDSKDRVAIVAWLWFIGWIAAGAAFGGLFGTPGTGGVWGFILALVTVFTWPYVMPGFVDRWLYDPSR